MRRQVDRRARIDEGVEVVAADAAQHLGKAALDLGGVPLRQRRNRAIARRLDARRRARARASCLGGQRPKCASRAVGQHHVLLAHVIDGLAVEHRAGAARVVGHHAADGGAAGRATRRARSAGRAACSAAFRSSSTTPGSTRAQRSSGLISRTRFRYFEVSSTRPAPIAWPACDVPPPRGVIGTPCRAAICDGADDVLARPRDDHAERLDLIDAGVGGVERARDAIEAHLAVDRAFEVALQRSDNPRPICGI